MAERAGEYARAERLLLQARWCDPRSVAALYLLADVWIREGKVVQGLREMAVLSRLLPGASVQLVPALAEYAKTPGARETLAGMLAENPQLKNPLLASLAADPANADLVVALAGPESGPPTPDTRAWQARLLTGLVNRGEYDRAYALWARFARLPQGARPLLYNGDFRSTAAPPPFNWSLTGSAAGFAEIDKGYLRILYYGRADSALASQLLLLPPGTYSFAAPASGQIAANALTWMVTCSGAKAPLAQVRVGPGTSGLSFTVPASGCRAQMLQLNGHQLDSPQDSDVRIGPATIERAAR